MIDKNAELRLEDTDDRLYTKNDSNGFAVYFLDKECKEPFTGEIYVKFKDAIESEAQYKNGYKNGIEYIYDSDGNLEQANENKGNVMYGVSKEYDENGNIVNASIVFNNEYLKSIELIDGTFQETTSYQDKFGEFLPDYLRELLSLSKEELFNYEFKPDNPHLNYSKK